MKTRKFAGKPEKLNLKPDPETAKPLTPSPATVVEIPPDPQAGRETIGYFLTPDGDVDLDRMNRKSIEKLKMLFQTPAIQKNVLKVEAPEAPKPEPVFPEFIVGKMYDAISMLEVAVSTRFFKIDAGVAERVLPFNEKEKALLVPATTVVIDKYSGDWLRTHKDEAVLITMLLLTLSAKFVQLRMQLAMIEEQKRMRVPASPPPQPAPAPSTEGEPVNPNGAAA